MLGMHGISSLLFMVSIILLNIWNIPIWNFNDKSILGNSLIINYETIQKPIFPSIFFSFMKKK